MARRDVERELDQTEREAEQKRHRPDERPPIDTGQTGAAGGDVHAAGASGGGSAVGGLAGSNIGRGDPDFDQLNEASGSGEFNRRLEQQDEPPYAGPEGGAVGGTPAGKRAEGGHTGGGISPKSSGRGDSTIGGDPSQPGGA